MLFKIFCFSGRFMPVLNSRGDAEYRYQKGMEESI